MKEKILGALAEFSTHLLTNMGRSITLSTLGAFNRLIAQILDALTDQ